jgi:hypothetical protein
VNELFPFHEILRDATYFAFTVGADEGGKMWSSTQTHWVGFADKERRVELREISPVQGERMAEHWKTFREPFYVVNDNRGFAKWMLSGGHALVTEEQTQRHLPFEFEPRPSVCEGRFGFTDLKQLPKTAFQKAPTPKLRMRVLKRDRYRCMICGQRPADDVNIQLHAHHVRPFQNRGVTTEKNLITLCHTCHAGLEPHYEFNLFDLLEKRDGTDNDLERRMLKEYVSGVQNYRKEINLLLSKYVRKKK